ncbi:MAG: hypothetical protein L0Y62_07805 [Nitrospirae bacterium]|nr:hypothetical protein [Nitrospirota bacterium]
MKILYILRRDADNTLNELISVHKEDNDVMVVDIRRDKEYDKIIDLIAESDKVISW